MFFLLLFSKRNARKETVSHTVSVSQRRFPLWMRQKAEEVVFWKVVTNHSCWMNKAGTVCVLTSAEPLTRSRWMSGVQSATKSNWIHLTCMFLEWRKEQRGDSPPTVSEMGNSTRMCCHEMSRLSPTFLFLRNRKFVWWFRNRFHLAPIVVYILSSHTHRRPQQSACVLISFSYISSHHELRVFLQWYWRTCRQLPLEDK